MKMKKIKSLLPLIPLLGLIVPVEGRLEAYAFWCATWSPAEAHIKINPNISDWAAGTAEDQILAHITGAYAWNNEGASYFDFHYDGTTTIDYIMNDGTNVLFAINWNGNGVLAETWCQQSGGIFNGFDIKYYDGDVIWNGPDNPWPGQVDIWAVTAHELGHGLGLDHSVVTTATMYAYYFLGARDLDTDDIDGVQARYGGQPNVVVRILPDDQRASFGPSGGSWTFSATAENTTGSSQTVDVWFDARLPNGATYGPLLGPISVSLDPYEVASANNISFQLPGSAPAGVYVIRMKSGTYPSGVDDESDVGLQKTSTALSSGEGSGPVGMIVIDRSGDLF